MYRATTYHCEIKHFPEEFKQWFAENAQDATQWQHIIAGCTCLLAKTPSYWFSTTPETGEWCVSDRAAQKMVLREGTVEDAVDFFRGYKSTYISFVGVMAVPLQTVELEEAYPLQYDEIFEGIDSHGDERYREVPVGFRNGLEYEAIDGRDSLTIYLAVIDEKIGHLVASCPAGGWADECFVCLVDGRPEKAVENFNPNPIPQLLD